MQFQSGNMSHRLTLAPHLIGMIHLPHLCTAQMQCKHHDTMQLGCHWASGNLLSHATPSSLPFSSSMFAVGSLFVEFLKHVIELHAGIQKGCYVYLQNLRMSNLEGRRRAIMPYFSMKCIAISPNALPATTTLAPLQPCSSLSQFA